MTTTTASEENPYVGPRALNAGDAFYGRTVEVYELFDMLVAERIVLLYSPSGAGKTSLLQAGVIPKLKEDGFRVLPPIRLAANKSAEDDTSSQGNRYVLSVLLRLEQEREPRRRRRPIDGLVGMTVAEYLKRQQVVRGQPRYNVLIFDQFEEVLTADPTDRYAKEEFFEQLGEVLEDRTYWALFAMREDYIALLDDYRDLLPTRLDFTYRLDLLRDRYALEAITGPAAGREVKFSKAAAEKVYDDLRQLRGLHDGDVSERRLGEYVEPVQLQVVCRSLWQRRRDPKRIDEADVADVRTDDALSDYYVECVQRAVAESGVDERRLRDWFDEQLVTREGLRNQTSEGPTGRTRRDRRIFTVLVDSHLLRSESIRGGTWYEIAHDRLIEPILQSNNQWRRETFIPLQHKAREWLQYNRAADFLLRGKAFLDAERWADRHPGQLSMKEQEYLDACRQAWKGERRWRRFRWFMFGLTILLLVAVGAASVAVYLALRQAQITESRQLVTAGLRNLSVDPELSILLGLQAARRSTDAEGHLGEADRDLLYRAVGTSRLRATFVRPAPAISTANPLSGSVTRPIEGLMDVALSPNGETVATAGWDGRVTIWRTDDASIVRELPGNRTPVTSLALHPRDGSLAIGADGAVVIVDPASGATRGRFPTVRGVVDLAYGEDGRHLAVATEDGTAIVWDARHRRLLTISPSRRIVVARAVALSPDGRSLAVAGVAGSVKLWGIATRSPSHSFVGHTAEVDTVAFSPDGRLLATASVDGSAKVWDAETGRNLTTLAGHTGSVLDISFSRDGARLATASVDGSAKVWDTATGRELLTLLGHKKAVSGAVFDPTGTTMFTSSWDGTVKSWAIASGHTGFVNSVAFDRNQQHLVTASADKTARIWDFPSGRELHSLIGHKAEVRQAIFNADGHRIATASTDRTARIWDTKTGQELHVLPTRSPLNGVAFSTAGGAVLATAGSDGSVILWDTSTGKRMETLVGGASSVNSVAFSPDGQHLATANEDGLTRIWDLSMSKSVRALSDRTGAVLRVSYSSDGKSLATASQGGTAAIWDASSGRLLQTLHGHASAVSEAIFCQRCRRLATASWDRTIKVWDLTKNRPTPELTIVQPAQINGVAFSPDDRFLATASSDKTIQVFPLRDADLLALARSKVTRSLTPAECETYLHRACPREA